MFKTNFLFRQQENLVDNQKCQAGLRPLWNQKLKLDSGENLALVHKLLLQEGQGNLIAPFRFPWVGSQKISTFIRCVNKGG